ncbi:MAG: C39 family peptidase [Acidobacteriota bacterium]
MKILFRSFISSINVLLPLFLSLITLTLLLFTLPLTLVQSGEEVPIQEEYLIKNVPFFSQEEHQCGPASLASVLNFWGAAISPEKVAKEIYSQSAKGTLWIDLALYAREQGFSAMQYYGHWEDLKENIRAGFPLIVFVDYGISAIQANHFMVVVGCNKDGVIVHSGKERERFEKKKKFMKAWRKTQNWTLLIKPYQSIM